MKRKHEQPKVDGGALFYGHAPDTRPHPDIATVDKEAIHRELKASRIRHTTRVRSYLP
jgi:hypothetical protein